MKENFKKIILVLVFMFLLKSMAVGATSLYYTNSNGVVLTQEEYEFVSEMFWEGFQKLMTVEDYNEIFEEDVLDKDITTKIYTEYNPIYTRGTQFTSPYKSIKISKSCVSNCLVTVTVDWTSIPTIKSYDVIGAYLKDTSLVSSPVTKATTSSVSQSSTTIKSDTNGFGVSIKLPSGANLMVTQYYKVSLGGHVYASYQHANQNISLANSQKYTISRSGYGGVFLFNSPYNSYYDGMTGVDIEL